MSEIIYTIVINLDLILMGIFSLAVIYELYKFHTRHRKTEV